MDGKKPSNRPRVQRDRDGVRKRTKRPAGVKRTSNRPLGLGEMAQKNFPFIAVVNGETMLVDRIGQRITFTPWK